MRFVTHLNRKLSVSDSISFHAQKNKNASQVRYNLTRFADSLLRGIQH